MTSDIRKAQKKDIKALQALSKRVIKQDFRIFLNHRVIDQFIVEGAVDAYVIDKRPQSTVITLNDRIIGYAVCQKALIDLMMIDQGFQRRGFGSILLFHCETTMFETYEVITLESFADNRKANRFYLKNKWTETGRFHDAISGADKITFEKYRTNRKE
jgi:ribosomal protein S18 acetylase RimI-like enzyme